MHNFPGLNLCDFIEEIPRGIIFPFFQWYTMVLAIHKIFCCGQHIIPSLLRLDHAYEKLRTGNFKFLQFYIYGKKTRHITRWMPYSRNHQEVDRCRYVSYFHNCNPCGKFDINQSAVPTVVPYKAPVWGNTLT